MLVSFPDKCTPLSFFPLFFRFFSYSLSFLNEQGEVSNLRSQVAEGSSMVASLRSMIAERDTQRAEAEQNMNVLSNRSVELEAKLKLFEQQLDDLKTVNMDLLLRLESQGHQLQDMRALQEDLERALREAEELRERCLTSEKKCSDLQSAKLVCVLLVSILHVGFKVSSLFTLSLLLIFPFSFLSPPF